MIPDSTMSVLTGEKESSARSMFLVGAVTQVSPLLVRLDGDTSPLPYSPAQLDRMTAVSVGDRVICTLIGGKVVVLGAIGGYVEPPSGVSDHGALTGLGDDDHTQYHNDARGDVRYSPLSHLHTGVYSPASQGVTNGDSHNHSGGDGGTIDHGALSGRSDDDHTQYHNDARGDARYPLKSRILHRRNDLGSSNDYVPSGWQFTGGNIAISPLTFADGVQAGDILVMTYVARALQESVAAMFVCASNGAVTSVTDSNIYSGSAVTLITRSNGGLSTAGGQVISTRQFTGSASPVYVYGGLYLSTAADLDGTAGYEAYNSLQAFIIPGS